MTAQEYQDWVGDGRPFLLARPVQDYREQLLAAGWGAVSIGTIGDRAHLTADPPQDHTPYSHTGWPVANPYPYVHAIDTSSGGPEGMPLADLGRQWIDDARSGLTPWVKYIVWQGKRYDVRNEWSPLDADDHFDHIHISMRTDWTYKSVGTYRVVRKGQTVGSTQTGRDVWAEPISSPSLDYNQPASEWLKWTYANHRSLEAIGTQIAGIRADMAATAGQNGPVVDAAALAAALASNEAFIAALAVAIGNRVGTLPTVDQIRDAVSQIRWTGERA